MLSHSEFAHRTGEHRPGVPFVVPFPRSQQQFGGSHGNSAPNRCSSHIISTEVSNVQVSKNGCLEQANAALEVMQPCNDQEYRGITVTPFAISFVIALCVGVGVRWQTGREVVQVGTTAGIVQALDTIEPDTASTVDSRVATPNSSLAGSGLREPVPHDAKLAADVIEVQSLPTSAPRRTIDTVAEYVGYGSLNAFVTPNLEAIRGHAANGPTQMQLKPGVGDRSTDRTVAGPPSENTIVCDTGVCRSRNQQSALADATLDDATPVSTDGSRNMSRHLSTALEWASSSAEASVLAKKQGKLVYLIHVSGNFEIPEFT